jgi:hypothetical protein
MQPKLAKRLQVVYAVGDGRDQVRGLDGQVSKHRSTGGFEPDNTGIVQLGSGGLQLGV